MLQMQKELEKLRDKNRYLVQRNQSLTFENNLLKSENLSLKNFMDKIEKKNNGLHIDYKCSKCFKLFNTKKNLVKHTRTHYALKQYKCLNKSCQKTFNSTKNLIRHNACCQLH